MTAFLKDFLKNQTPWDIPKEEYFRFCTDGISESNFQFKDSVATIIDQADELFEAGDWSKVSDAYQILTSFFDEDEIQVKYFRFKFHLHSFLAKEKFEDFHETIAYIEFIVALLKTVEEKIEESPIFEKECEYVTLLADLLECIYRNEYKQAFSIFQDVSIWNEKKVGVLQKLYREYAKFLKKCMSDDTEFKILILEKKLRTNPADYSIYEELSELLLEKNKQQAYLCLENAAFFCEDEARKAVIKAKMDGFVKASYSVPKAAIIVLNYNTRQMTIECIESILDTTPESAREIIVVDNGSSDDSVEHLRKIDGIKLIENKTNAGFPGGCNIGIGAAGEESDIYLLNSDTVLTTNALFWLRMKLYENERNGAVGSVANNVTNNQQYNGNEKSVEYLKNFAQYQNSIINIFDDVRFYLIGFSELIRRTVVDQVGLLDEVYFPGNFEDNDYGLRIVSSGYRNLVCKNSFIIHYGSMTFSKNKSEEYMTLFERNMQIFIDKWDIDDEKKIIYSDDALYNVIDGVIAEYKPENLVLYGVGVLATGTRAKKIDRDVKFTIVEKSEPLISFTSALDGVTNIEEVINQKLNKPAIICSGVDEGEKKKLTQNGFREIEIDLGDEHLPVSIMVEDSAKTIPSVTS